MKIPRRLAFAIGVLATVSLQTGQAQAATLHYFATLNGVSESPANASPAFGDAEVTINTALSTIKIDVTFQDLLANLTSFSFNCCTATSHSSTSNFAMSLVAKPATGTSGSYSQSYTSADIDGPYFAGLTAPDALTALLAGLDGGKAYFNIGTSVFPGGEIRGFFEVETTPVPGTLPLFVSGLGAIGLLRWRKKRKSTD
jgi:hypothetical protein